ncbi:uncharacterized protein LOC123553906 [Mercenaria mercenaria]|uniref:uncharacterized protein LOC123553906 n=1 Tax=Mercenaria mercenaria TaxID=6596 RepID=UPI001E1D9F52|nr:uncharacterized protein LOC123553906 [Mercenaria mercenaria]XP_045199581.1 uncharacterized protein LOC123553906 [Mercenaria mercenaria]XP_045199582.1 uncharacterized protein LOC123553906 [Mercenaria mercenaria]
MSGSTMSSKPLIIKNGSHHTCNSDVGSCEIKIQESDKKDDGFQPQDQIPCQYMDKPELIQSFRSLKKLFLLLATLNMLLIIACFVLVIHKESECTRKSADSVKMVEDVKTIVQENLLSSNSLNIVRKHIFCASCDAVRDVMPHFFESVDNNRCCIENISTLLRLLKYILLKNLNEYNSEVRNLKSSIEDLKEDTNILENALFSSNKTNVTEGTDYDIRRETVMWSTIQKNNQLINTVLNHRRSALHLSGTAGETSIHWSEEVQSGDLSYDDGGIHVRSGGKYFIYSSIHFSKKVCDGTENFGYSIDQEYSPGEFIPIARVEKHCATSRSIDTGLLAQSVLQVDLGQHGTLRIQYDRNNQEFIAKENKLHTIIVFEI